MQGFYTSRVFNRISKSTKLYVSCEESSPLDDPSCLSWKNWHLTYVKYCSYMLSAIWWCFLCERVVVVWFQPLSLGKREEGTHNSQHPAWCDPGDTELDISWHDLFWSMPELQNIWYHEWGDADLITQITQGFIVFRCNISAINSTSWYQLDQGSRCYHHISLSGSWYSETPRCCSARLGLYLTCDALWSVWVPSLGGESGRNPWGSFSHVNPWVIKWEPFFFLRGGSKNANL